MKKLVWRKWFSADWLSEITMSRATLAGRGLWAEALNVMMAGGIAEIRGTSQELALMLRASYNEFVVAFASLEKSGLADIQRDGEVVIIRSRRLERELDVRVSNRERMARFREKGGGNPERWTAIRVDILRRDDYRCAYCARRATTVDHVIPRSRGGGEQYWNLVASCKACNFRKNDRPLSVTGMSFHSSFNINNLEKGNSEVTQPTSASASASLVQKGVQGGQDSSPAVELPKSFPTCVEDAIDHGLSVGAPPDFVEATWNQAFGRGGSDARGQPIRSWAHHLAAQWKYDQNRRHEMASRGANGHHARPAFPETQLKAIQDLIEKHIANPAHSYDRKATDAECDHFKSLKRKLRELQQQIAGV